MELNFSAEDDPEILLHEADMARDLLYDTVAEYNVLRQGGHGIIGAYVVLCDRHGEANLPTLQAILDLRAELSWKGE